MYVCVCPRVSVCVAVCVCVVCVSLPVACFVARARRFTHVSHTQVIQNNACTTPATRGYRSLNHTCRSPGHKQ